MASCKTFFQGAFPDITALAMDEQIIRQTAIASNVFNGKLFVIREYALGGDFSLVKID